MTFTPVRGQCSVRPAALQRCQECHHKHSHAEKIIRQQDASSIEAGYALRVMHVAQGMYMHAGVEPSESCSRTVQGVC